MSPQTRSFLLRLAVMFGAVFVVVCLVAMLVIFVPALGLITVAPWIIAAAVLLLGCSVLIAIAACSGLLCAPLRCYVHRLFVSAVYSALAPALPPPRNLIPI